MARGLSTESAAGEAAVLLERRAGDEDARRLVRVITLNRPAKRNAIDEELRAALNAAFERANQDEAVRALVLTGAGGNFCAGGDLTTMKSGDAEAAVARMAGARRAALAIAGCKKPVIAAVEGHAAGAGLGLALLCDEVISAAGARFSLSFVRVGLAPDWGLTATLPLRVGRSRARSMAWDGASLTEEEALAIGLVDRLVPRGAAILHAIARAADLAAAPLPAVRAIKSHFRVPEVDLDAALRREGEAQQQNFLTAEFAEGRAAFLEKRGADFERFWKDEEK